MVKRTVFEENINDILAGSATKIVETCRKLNCKVTLWKNCIEADGCSFLQIISLATEKGSKVEVTVEGRDEHKAICRLVNIFESETIRL